MTLGFQKKCCSNCEAIKRFLNEKFLCECSAPVVPGQRCDMDPGFLDAGERVLALKQFLPVITNVYLMRQSKTLAGRDLKLKLVLTIVLPSCT